MGQSIASALPGSQFSEKPPATGADDANEFKADEPGCFSAVDNKFAEWNESDHPRENDGEFSAVDNGAEHGGATGQFTGPGGGEAANAGESSAKETRKPKAGDFVHGYLEDFNGPKEEPATAQDVRDANKGLKGSGSNFRLIPTGDGKFEARHVADLRNEIGNDWTVATNPLSGKLEAGSADYYREVKPLAGDKQSRFYVQMFNGEYAGNVHPLQLQDANKTLASEGSKLRIEYSEEYGKWVAKPAPATFSESPAGQAPGQVALPGHAGDQVEALLEHAKQEGIGALEEICRPAFERALEGSDPNQISELFTGEERQRLADLLASVHATADLLGRSTIRKQQEAAREGHATKFAEWNESDHPRENDGEFSAVDNGAEHGGSNGQFTGNGGGGPVNDAEPAVEEQLPKHLEFIDYDRHQDLYPENRAALDAGDALQNDYLDSADEVKRMAQTAIATSLARNEAVLEHLPEKLASKLEAWTEKQLPKLDKKSAELSAKIEEYHAANKAEADHRATEPPEEAPGVAIEPARPEPAEPESEPEPSFEDFASETEYNAAYDAWEKEDEKAAARHQNALEAWGIEQDEAETVAQDAAQDAHDKARGQWEKEQSKIGDRQAKAEEKAFDARDRFLDALDDVNQKFADKVMDWGYTQKPAKLSESRIRRFSELEPNAWGPLKLRPPQDALEYFRSLMTGGQLGIPSPQRWGDRLERHAFTLAQTTEETLLDKVHSFLSQAIESGELGLAGDREKGIVGKHASELLDDMLDAAGVKSSNPQYSDMVIRTNLMDGYNTGSDRERQHPDAIEDFPVWRYDGIDDGREGDDHFPHFGKYYPASVSFAEVRGDRPFNCRCGATAIFRTQWAKLQAAGARVETEWGQAA
jgi:hypothetical protein